MEAIARAMRRLGKMLFFVLSPLMLIMRSLVKPGILIFGRLEWQPPKWFNTVAERYSRLRNLAQKHQKYLLGISGIVLIAALVAAGGSLVWALLPKPVEPELVHFARIPGYVMEAVRR